MANEYIAHLHRPWRATQIHDLSKIIPKRVKAKLTTSSPTKRLYWRMMGNLCHSRATRLFVLQRINTEDMVVR